MGIAQIYFKIEKFILHKKHKSAQKLIKPISFSMQHNFHIYFTYRISLDLNLHLKKRKDRIVICGMHLKKRRRIVIWILLVKTVDLALTHTLQIHQSKRRKMSGILQVKKTQVFLKVTMKMSHMKKNNLPWLTETAPQKSTKLQRTSCTTVNML